MARRRSTPRIVLTATASASRLTGTESPITTSWRGKQVPTRRLCRGDRIRTCDLPEASIHFRADTTAMDRVRLPCADRRTRDMHCPTTRLRLVDHGRPPWVADNELTRSWGARADAVTPDRKRPRSVVLSHLVPEAPSRRQWCREQARSRRRHEPELGREQDGARTGPCCSRCGPRGTIDGPALRASRRRSQVHSDPIHQSGATVFSPRTCQVRL